MADAMPDDETTMDNPERELLKEVSDAGKAARAITVCHQCKRTDCPGTYKNKYCTKCGHHEGRHTTYN